MTPVTRFTTALQTSHTMATRLDAYRGGQLVASGLQYIDGEVAAARVTGIRRGYNLNVPATPQWKALLATPGLELRPFRGLNYGYGPKELYPLGRFPVMANSLDTAVGNAIPVSTSDYWSLIVADQFTFPRASPTGQIRYVMAQLMDESLSQIGLPKTIVTATSTLAVTPVVWASDRSGAIGELATSISAEAFIDANGQPWVQDRKPIGVPVYTVTDGVGGTRVNLVATTDWSGVFNVVSVTSTTTDPAFVFPNITVSIQDPTSPAYWRRIGRRVYPYSSAQVYTTAQATSVAQTLLAKYSQPARTLAISCVPNVTLNEGDTIATTVDGGRTENAQIQTITYPMTDDGVQKITTISGGGN